MNIYNIYNIYVFHNINEYSCYEKSHRNSMLTCQHSLKTISKKKKSSQESQLFSKSL